METNWHQEIKIGNKSFAYGAHIANLIMSSIIYDIDDVVFPQAKLTCSRESCFSAAETLASSPFLVCSSASRHSVFSPSSLVNFAHS